MSVIRVCFKSQDIKKCHYKINFRTEQHGLVGDIPDYGGGLGNRWSLIFLPTQDIPWFYEESGARLSGEINSTEQLIVAVGYFRYPTTWTGASQVHWPALGQMRSHSSQQLAGWRTAESRGCQVSACTPGQVAHGHWAPKVTCSKSHGVKQGNRQFKVFPSGIRIEGNSRQSWVHCFAM